MSANLSHIVREFILAQRGKVRQRVVPTELEGPDIQLRPSRIVGENIELHKVPLCAQLVLSFGAELVIPRAQQRRGPLPHLAAARNSLQRSHIRISYVT